MTQLQTTIESEELEAKRERDRTLRDLELSRTGMVFEPEEHPMDPFSHYARFRDRDPVHHRPRIDGFVLTRHEDCLEALRDPRMSSDGRHYRGADRLRAQIVADGGDPAAMDNPSMINLDGPAHTRLRGLVSRGFTPRAISALGPRIESIVGELLDEVDPGSVFDWMKTIAHPLPSIVIAEMLGVPKEDRARFQRWSAALLAGGVLETPARRAAAFQANRELSDYIVEIIAERRSKPGPDILSALIRVQEEDGDRLNTRELIGTCILLLIAGHAGTSAMIGNGLLTLAHHPDQLALLRADKSLWPSAVEEMLRFEGAVPSMVRVATEEMRIHGKLLRKGQNVELVLASANRDPDVFEDPDRFDITRHPNNHLGLGRGSHFCLGASLARMEMRIALDEFLERFPTFELASSEVHWNPRGMRTLLELPIRARC